jgi:WD40 repeat protein
VAWSPVEDKISAGGKDSPIKVWDATSGELLLTLAGHELPTNIGDLNWSPDGDRLLSVSGNPDEGSRDNTVRIWDTNTGEQLLVIEGHAATVWWGDWSPDGTRIVTTSFDRTTRIWDASTGAELLTLATPSDWGVFAPWSPDGTRLITTGHNIPATVWRVWQSTEDLIDYAYECCVFRELTVEERQLFGLPEREQSEK